MYALGAILMLLLLGAPSNGLMLWALLCIPADVKAAGKEGGV